MSWESSIEHERIINRETRRLLGETHSADLIIRSYDFARIGRLQDEGLWPEAAALLAGNARLLEAAGAEITLLCTNTMHRVADESKPPSTSPFSIWPTPPRKPSSSPD